MPDLCLTEEDLITVINALYTAASVHECGAINADQHGQPKIAEQFREQAKRAKELAQAFAWL